MRHHFSLFFISLLVRTFFLAAPLAAEDVLSQSKELSIKLIDKNFFTDRIATALIQHAQPLTLHSDAPFTDSQLKLINVSSHETKQKILCSIKLDYVFYHKRLAVCNFQRSVGKLPLV